jgi:hypothetical protein
MASIIHSENFNLVYLKYKTAKVTCYLGLRKSAGKFNLAPYHPMTVR